MNLCQKTRALCALLLCALLLSACGQDAAPADTASNLTCTLSISCTAVLDQLPPEKAGLLPEDGWILPATTVSFTEGETAFDLLQRFCREQEIHLEFDQAPGMDSAYIQGIGNLYEFDCGDRSGWTYYLNGESPNSGCSEAVLQDGDTVAWEYLIF